MYRENILLVQGNNNLQVFDLNGNLLLCPELKDEQGIPISMIASMCVQDSRLYVSDMRNCKIHGFDSNYNHLFCLRTGTFHPSFFCIQKSGNFVITDNYMGDHMDAITLSSSAIILDQSGNLVKQFGNDGEQSGDFRGINGIYCNAQDEIVISDYANRRIQVFDKDGNFQRVIGSESVLYSLDGIYLDSDDNIFALDTLRGKIIIFESKGPVTQWAYFPKSPTSGGNLFVVDKRIFVVCDKEVYIFSNK